MDGADAARYLVVASLAQAVAGTTRHYERAHTLVAEGIGARIWVASISAPPMWLALVSDSG
jgi:hypothetical protein